MLFYENYQNPFVERRERVSSYLSVALRFITLNDSIKKKALTLENFGIEPMDALHLAYADYSGADFFLTCDNGIIKKIKKCKDILRMVICKPLEFVLEEVFKNA